MRKGKRSKTPSRSQPQITSWKGDIDAPAAAVPERLRPALEFVKAGQRLLAQRGAYGGAVPSALMWLLTFSQENLDALSAGGLADRWEEAKRFAVDAGLGGAAEPGEPPFTNQASLTISMPRPAPILDTLKSLQRAAQDVLRAYLETGQATSEALRIALHVSRTRRGVFVHAADLRAGFLYQLFHLLGASGSRIRQCRCCARLLLAGRTDKEFCSARCQAKQYKRDHAPAQRTRTKGGQHAAKR